MIENLVQPKPLDNDIAVIKIMQLMGQLIPKDIQYVLQVTQKIYGIVQEVETT